MTAGSAGAGPGVGPAASRARVLDVFRGATVALMILVNNPGSWQHLYAPLAHARWHGCTATDLVFPFFLTAVGLSLAMVMPGWQAGLPAGFWHRWWRRSLLIFALGLLLNAAPLVRWGEAGQLVLRDPGTLRIMGVLQRIALSWALAALLLWWLRHRSRPMRDVAWAVAALLGATGVCAWRWATGRILTAWKASSAPRSTVPGWGRAICTKARACPSTPRVWPARCRRWRRCCWAGWWASG